MTTYFTGIGGGAGGPGTTWANRFDLPSNMIGAAAHSYGDRLLVGPGTYREIVTLDTPGGAYTYAVGTIDVTNESTAVTGNVTNWLAGPVVAGDLLFVGNFETQADGACPGGALTMTSVLSTPEDAMIGYMIEIMGRGPYLIANTSLGPNTFTLSDPNGLGNPAVGAGLTYYVQSGEGPYEIASVDGAAAITLSKPWSGPTLTTIPYIIYRPARLIGDVTGAETDGVGGVVRITGSDDDEARARVRSIDALNDDYWLIRGFQIDCCTGEGIFADTCDYLTIEDCVFHDCEDAAIETDDGTQITVRRCIMTGSTDATGVYLFANPAIDNAQSLVANCYMDCGERQVRVNALGGITVKNITLGFGADDGIYVSGINTGAGVFVHDSLLHFQSSAAGTDAALEAAVLGQIVSQYNNFWNNANDVTLAVITAEDTAYPYLPSLPLLMGRPRVPMYFFPPSEWDQTRYAAGLYGANEDLFGVHKETAQTLRSWGATHAYAVKRDTGIIYDGFVASLYMENACEAQSTHPVQASLTYTITVQVNIEANYAGSVPDMVIRQPGEADVIIASSGALGVWEQLTVAFTTGTEMDWISVGLRSHNTATVPAYGVFWSDIQVRR